MKAAGVRAGQVRIVDVHMPVWNTQFDLGYDRAPALTLGTVVMVVARAAPPTGFSAGRWYDLLIDGEFRVSRDDLIDDRTWLLG